MERVKKIIENLRTYPQDKWRRWLKSCFMFLALVLMFRSVWFSSRLVFITPFHQDEFQHTHIAWNVLSGKVIYRDFFETHGPIGAWLNSFFLKLKPEPIVAKETFIYLRKVYFTVFLLGSIFVFFAVRAATGNTLVSVCGWALYLQLASVKRFSFMIRPDVFVGALSVLGLYFWLKNKRFIAGLCLGMASGFHPKFLPLNIPILMADFWIERKAFKLRSFQRWAFLAGQVAIGAALSLVLFWQQAFFAAVHHLILLNLDGVLVRFKYRLVPAQLFSSLFSQDKWFLSIFVFFFLGFVLLCWKKEERVDRKVQILFAVGAVSLIFLRTPVYGYGLLIVVPFLVVCTVFFICKIVRGSILPALFLLTLSVVTAPWGMRPPEGASILTSPTFLQFDDFLKKVPRNAPVFYVWYSRCPVFVFNSDPEHDWVHYPTPPTQNFFRREQKGIEKLKLSTPVDKVRFSDPSIGFVAIEDRFVGQISIEERFYLVRNFSPNGCLWSRSVQTEMF